MNPRALRVNNGPFSRLYIFHVDSPFLQSKDFFRHVYVGRSSLQHIGVTLEKTLLDSSTN